MNKARILFVLGVWVAILPYLGFPSSWKSLLFTLTGLILIYLSYSSYKNIKEKEGKKTFDNFMENKEFKTENPEPEKIVNEKEGALN